jgi:hypothetical protein
MEARNYCPGCEPDADPFAEILDVVWCGKHYPAADGVDDPEPAAASVVADVSDVR